MIENPKMCLGFGLDYRYAQLLSPIRRIFFLSSHPFENLSNCFVKINQTATQGQHSYIACLLF